MCSSVCPLVLLELGRAEQVGDVEEGCYSGCSETRLIANNFRMRSCSVRAAFSITCSNGTHTRTAENLCKPV